MKKCVSLLKPMETSFISLQEFTALYGKYRSRFTDIAFSYLQDRKDAEDVVSDSFLAFWSRREEAGLPEKLPAYVLGIVKHKCLDRLRSRSSDQERVLNMYEQACREAKIRVLENDSLTQKLFEDEIVQIFELELEKMPPLRRSIFLYSRAEGKTYKEIAETLGISQRMVTREVQAALSTLRQSLKDYLPLMLAIVAAKGWGL